MLPSFQIETEKLLGNKESIIYQSLVQLSLKKIKLSRVSSLAELQKLLLTGIKDSLLPTPTPTPTPGTSTRLRVRNAHVRVHACPWTGSRTFRTSWQLVSYPALPSESSQTLLRAPHTSPALMVKG